MYVKTWNAFHLFAIHQHSKEFPTQDISKPRHISPLMQHTGDLPFVRRGRGCKNGLSRSSVMWSHPLQLSLSRCDNIPWRYSLAPTEPHKYSTTCNVVRHTHLWCPKELTCAIYWPEMEGVAWTVTCTWRHAFHFWTVILAANHYGSASMILHFKLKTRLSFVNGIVPKYIAFTVNGVIIIMINMTEILDSTHVRQTMSPVLSQAGWK